MLKFVLFGFLLTCGGFGGVLSLVSSTTSQNYTGVFAPVSASAAFVTLNPGWNLGNTLDATPDEGIRIIQSGGGISQSVNHQPRLNFELTDL
jgi:hypothetical protein